MTSPWGTNPAGLEWVCDGPTEDFGPMAGQITPSVPAAIRTAHLPPQFAEVDASALISVDQQATGDWIVARIVARYIDPTTWVSASIEYKHDGTCGVALHQSVSGSVTWLGGAGLGAYTADQWQTLRFQANGATLQAKVWPGWRPEPDHWQVVSMVATVTSPGSVGLSAHTQAANTNVDPVVTFRQFSVPNPQAFTVSRSTNRIEKAHTAGTTVSLARPLVLAL